MYAGMPQVRADSPGRHFKCKRAKRIDHRVLGVAEEVTEGGEVESWKSSAVNGFLAYLACHWHQLVLPIQ